MPSPCLSYRHHISITSPTALTSPVTLASPDAGSDFDTLFVSVNALSDRDAKEQEEEYRRQVEEELQRQGGNKSASKKAAAAAQVAQGGVSGAEKSAEKRGASGDGEGDNGGVGEDGEDGGGEDGGNAGGEGDGEEKPSAGFLAAARAGFQDADDMKKGRAMLKRQSTVKFDDKNGMSRVEFLVALVRVAINRYCLSGRKLRDVSQVCLFLNLTST